jgi:hypothetical protein
LDDGLGARAWVKPPLPRAGVHGAWLCQRWNEAIGLRICDLNQLHREVTFGRPAINQNGSATFTMVESKPATGPSVMRGTSFLTISMPHEIRRAHPASHLELD